jgi:general L-amino acid transport system substrate-binding protein
MPSRRSAFLVSFIAVVPAMQQLATAQESPDRGTAVMLRHAMNLTSALQLSGASLCMQEATQADVADYFVKNNIEYQPAIFASSDEAFASYDGERCDAVVADVSVLQAARVRLTNPDEHVILPERLTPE